MVVLITCKNDEYPIKNKGARVVTLFIDFQTLKGSLLRSPWTNLGEIHTHPSFYRFLVTCKNEEDPFENEDTSRHISPIINLWGFFQTLKGS